MDWLEWHREYDADSPLRRRLQVVRQCLADALLAHPPGAMRLISMCAGDGRDVLSVLPRHPRAPDVTATLVEIEPTLASRARQAALRAGSSQVEVLIADAGSTTAYAAAVPADIVLACGIFGNVTHEAIERTIRQLPRLCSAGATVIWTRHRRPPDLTPSVRHWFAESGFEEVAFRPIPDSTGSVGVHRLVGDPLPYQPDLELFTFVR